MGTTISVLNLKGGVGKTSTCHHLAGTLGKAGRRVLLVDNDPQASLTQGIWGPEATRSLNPNQSVAAVYDPDLSPLPAAVIRPTGFANVSIIAGSRWLEDCNMTPKPQWGASERGMRDFLDEVRDDYDVTLIDNPPNLYLCSRASLVAADFIMVPLQPEDYGSQGIGPVLEAVLAVRSGPNRDLRMLGLLITMWQKRLGIHEMFEGNLRELYGDKVFAAKFPAVTDFKEAVAARQPIALYKPRSVAAKATAAIADELLARVQAAATAAGRAA